MAQAIRRKASVGREAVSRPPAPHASVKGFGDGAGKQAKTRNKSKTKIPKALRHDLENALVNLCDIWFEEIKPHLIRNNIKLHVHEDKAGGEGCLPAGAPGCSHLDPASSSTNCDLCVLLFTAANNIESAVAQAAATPHHAS